jgi:GH24 family phage-related lysozyme (muramidase)
MRSFSWEKHFDDMSRKSKRSRSAFGADSVSGSDLQTALNAHGASLKVDGKVGPLTIQAVKNFQQQNGLVVDGIAGPKTLAALGFAGADTVSASPSAPPPSSKGKKGKLGKTHTVLGTPATADHTTEAMLSSVEGLRPIVLSNFTDFTTKFEGYTPYMYTDVKGLVTTGIGNLIDNGTSGPALGLNWKHANGTPATQAEIDAAWHTVKSAWPGVQSTACQKLTDLRLDKEDIAKLVAMKLKENHEILRSKYPGYVKWPADAQMGLHSMAWAMGPAFNFPAFTTAVNKPIPDFADAAIQSHMNDKGNPGLVPRNQANKIMFTNAAQVLAKKANPDVLYWPSTEVKAILAISTILLLGGAGVLLFILLRKPPTAATMTEIAEVFPAAA